MAPEAPIPRFAGAEKLPNRRRLLAAGVFMVALAIAAAAVVESARPEAAESAASALAQPHDVPSRETEAEDDVERDAERRHELESLVDDARSSERRARAAIETARKQGFDPEFVDELERELAPRESLPNETKPRPTPAPIEVIPVLPADGRAL